jgi:biotin-(acetyl-CoA carboxylase) ligase
MRIPAHFHFSALGQLFASLESSADVVAIGASSQTKGRGTSGRAWVGLSGNVFLTVAIKRDAVPYIPTLLPLRIGTIIARGRHHYGMI